MPWMETDPMREREKFVRNAQTGLWTMTELCERHGISRKTGYKILARFEEEGEAGLQDRSRAPRHRPHRMSPASRSSSSRQSRRIRDGELGSFAPCSRLVILPSSSSRAAVSSTAWTDTGW